MRSGIFNIGILRLAPDQVAQRCFRFGVLFLSMQEQGAKISRLIVTRMPGQNRLDTIPGLVQTSFLLKPDRQADAGVHGIRIGSHSIFITRAGVVQLPEPLVLHPDHAKQSGILRGQLARAAVGLVGEQKIEFAGCGVAQFKP